MRTNKANKEKTKLQKKEALYNVGKSLLIYTRKSNTKIIPYK